MTKNEIFENLCQYDPRNLDHDHEFDGEILPRNDCYCDNCFYGRDNLALELIKMSMNVDN